MGLGLLFLILQLIKLGLREVKSLVQGHTAELSLKIKVHGLLRRSSFPSQRSLLCQDLEEEAEVMLGAKEVPRPSSELFATKLFNPVVMSRCFESEPS